MGFPGSSVGKESAWKQEVLIWILGQEDPLEKEIANCKLQIWESLPGKSHGQKSLLDCSPWDHIELGMTDN